MNSWLYHFSEDADIKHFVPRPVKTWVDRPDGLDWLNGPLVWAIDAAFSPLYLFPRECPRIVMMKLDTSTEDDIAKYWQNPSKPIVAFIEEGWVEQIETTRLYRYCLKRDDFLDLHDVGMHVTKTTAIPSEMVEIIDIFSALDAANVEVRILPDLSGLQDAWNNSLQVSGIRLRNAKNWNRDLFWLRPDADKTEI